ncbi:MAG: hypothetical protein H6643_11410 [Caldilineaceae bacterium]|nr:hypothetical protein [Caldilineaceae bacterium]
MNHARRHFPFYGNLSDFLPGDRRNTLIEQRRPTHRGQTSIETLGIRTRRCDPVNRQAVDFAYRLDDGDRVGLPPEVVHCCRPVPLRPRRAGSLRGRHPPGPTAAYLRLLGFDTSIATTTTTITGASLCRRGACC